MHPLQNILKPEVHCVVFFKLNELHEIHTNFLSLMLKSFTDKILRLSTVFMVSRDSFLIYGDYAGNLPRAQAILKEICKEDKDINQAVIVSRNNILPT